MAESVDILDESTDALAMITIMRNETLSKKPDHEFIDYFNRIETTIRKMRERNLKLLGDKRSLELSLSQLNDIDQAFEEHIESLPDKQEPDEWNKRPMISKQFDEPKF